MQIFRLTKKVFFSRINNFIKFYKCFDCISMKNQECKVKPEIININSNNSIFYPFSVKIDRCNGNCYNINDPYARI